MQHSAQRGFTPLYLLLIGSVILGLFWITNQPKQVQMITPFSTSLKQTPIHEDSELKFQFEYPQELEIVEESEEQYSERTKTQYRKNFKYYVAYEPPKFVKGLLIKPKDMKLSSNQFEEIPLTLWVFENPQKLDAPAWYKDFWYYPFVWGIFDEPRKGKIGPSEDATISGIMAKSGTVSYSPGKPKFILLPKDEKMFLFKIMGDGDKILGSFKLL